MAARPSGAARGGVTRKRRGTRETQASSAARSLCGANAPAARNRHRSTPHFATTVARATATIAPRSRTILSFR
ncbi:hypothetical protein BURMUCGD1_4959 [Burkholderia multivorans CGD1]|nr:hypothetical protein BURMUCGD1_4959 [Burkholderia multivorans CGD1]